MFDLDGCTSYKEIMAFLLTFPSNVFLIQIFWPAFPLTSPSHIFPQINVTTVYIRNIKTFRKKQKKQNPKEASNHSLWSTLGHHGGPKAEGPAFACINCKSVTLRRSWPWKGIYIHLTSLLSSPPLFSLSLSLSLWSLSRWSTLFWTESLSEAWIRWSTLFWTEAPWRLEFRLLQAHQHTVSNKTLTRFRHPFLIRSPTR